MLKIDHPLFPYYRFERLGAAGGMLHFVSSGSRTLGFPEGEDGAEVRENRRRLAQAVGFDVRRLVTAQQVHGTHVAVVAGEDAGRGALDRPSRLPQTDALVTAIPGVCLMVLSADCVPVLLFDPVCRVIAAVHAGWRGTAAGIVARTVRTMQERWGCLPADILAGVAPSIGPCCFEVGEEVAQVFRNLHPGNPEVVLPARGAGKSRVDLWASNRLQLLAAGLQPDHIEVAGCCSMCHPDAFFSYRRQGQAAGRFGAGIVLLPDVEPLNRM